MLKIDPQQILGQGGSSTVFLGMYSNSYAFVDGAEKIISKDENNEFLVAVKRQRLDKVKNQTKEASILKKLAHPNIIKFFDQKTDTNYSYLVLEYADFCDLYDALYIKKISFSASQILSITKNIADALEYVHFQKFIHRDIKPENIVLNKNLQAKITDFGIATDECNSIVNTFYGTKEYIAPEIASSKIYNRTFHYTPASDIYSFGITILETVLGCSAYGNNAEPPNFEDIACGKILPIPENTDPRLFDIITCCLIKSPQERISANFIVQFLDIVLQKFNAGLPINMDGRYNIVHFAARLGNFEILKKIFSYDNNLIESQDYMHNTALLWAASCGHDKMVSFLIDLGAKLNVSTKFENHYYNNYSPLDWAISIDCRQSMDILKESGCIANIFPNIFKGKNLHDIVKMGLLEDLNYILDCNPNFVNQTDTHGFTLLHIAANYSQLKIARYLIAKGADLNKTSNLQLNGFNYKDITALEIVLINNKQKDDDLALYLIDNNAVIPESSDGKFDIIHLVARKGRLDLIKKYIEYYPELLNIRDNNNYTPLVWAAARGYPDIVQYLISNGAEIDTAALEWAEENNHDDCVVILKLAQKKSRKRVDNPSLPFFNSLQPILSNKKPHFERSEKNSFSIYDI